MIIILAVAGCASFQRSACVPVPDGLVAWWSPNRTTNLGTNVQIGTMKGTMAFYFNGSKGGIWIPDSSVLRFGTDDLTINAWIRTPQGTYGTFIGKELQAYPYPSVVFRVQPTTGALEFAVTDCGTGACGWGNSRASVLSPFPIADGKVHHVAGIRNAYGYELYIDGRLVSTRSEEPRNPDSTAAIYIGMQAVSINGAPYNSFTGMITDVEIFNRTLTPSEIQAIYNAGPGGQCNP